ncbi:hypothetical protein ACVWWW_000804 [Lysobacter sp. HA18]
MTTRGRRRVAFGERQRFQREDRQNARHEVEHEPAEQREQQRGQRVAGLHAAWRGRRLARGHRERCARRRRSDARRCTVHCVVCRRRCSIGRRRGRCRDRQSRRNRTRRQFHIDRARHRRIADAVVLAALEACGELECARGRRGARHRQRQIDRVEIHRDVAEMFVAMHARLRPARCAEREARCARSGIELERGAIAIQVVTGCWREAHEHGVRRAGNRFKTERLFGRQRCGVDARGRAACKCERRAAECGCGRSVRGRQVDSQAPRLRGITDARIRAALVLDRHHRARGRRRARQRCDERIAIGFDVAEEFVVMCIALGQPHRARVEGGVGLHADAVAIQVVALRDRPAHFDRAVGVARARYEHAVDRRQLIGRDRMRAQRHGAEEEETDAGDPAQQVRHSVGSGRSPSRGRRVRRPSHQARAVRARHRGAGPVRGRRRPGCGRPPS